jgi:hypothetical protein
MVCHGDVGQGLDAWRAGLEPPDNNCFEAKCHGPRHPRDGFVIPEYAPVIMGAGILDHYGNAAALHESMVETMPWWNPGYLTEAEYWQITAFLLRANGIDTSNIILDEKNAEAIIIQTK